MLQQLGFRIVLALLIWMVLMSVAALLGVL